LKRISHSVEFILQPFFLPPNVSEDAILTAWVAQAWTPTDPGSSSEQEIVVVPVGLESSGTNRHTPVFLAAGA
jgi:hypothetical protein